MIEQTEYYPRNEVKCKSLYSSARRVELSKNQTSTFTKWENKNSRNLFIALILTHVITPNTNIYNPFEFENISCTVHVDWII